MPELYVTGSTRVMAHLNNNYRKIYKIGLDGASKPHGSFLCLKAGTF